MNKVAIVTGATAGFGRAIARSLISRSYIVVATGRREALLQTLQAECGEKLIPRVLDMIQREAVARVFAEIEATFGRVDILVNNAGLALGVGPAQAASLDDWDRMIDTNIKGLVYATRAVLPGMVARGEGWIFNLGSIAGQYPYPGGNVYGATKAFVKQFTLNLRADIVGTGVHATCIEPGLCGGTQFSVTRLGGDEAAAAAVYAGTDPLVAEDIAATLCWMLDMPSRVNVNRIEMMPTCQAPGRLNVVKTPEGS